VYPSVFNEGAIPLVIRESLTLGTPIVAAHGSAVADLVLANGIGTVFSLKDEQSLQEALAGVERMTDSDRVRIKDFAEREFSRSAWVRRIHAIFQEAMLESSRP